MFEATFWLIRRDGELFGVVLPLDVSLYTESLTFLVLETLSFVVMGILTSVVLIALSFRLGVREPCGLSFIITGLELVESSGQLGSLIFPGRPKGRFCHRPVLVLVHWNEDDVICEDIFRLGSPTDLVVAQPIQQQKKCAKGVYSW